MEDIFKKIKELVDSGTPPTRQRLRGDPPPKESPVAKKRRLEKRTQFTEKTDRGALKVDKKIDRGTGSYQEGIAKKGGQKGTFRTDEPTSIKQARQQKKDFFFDKKTGKKKAAVTVAQLAAFRKSSGNAKATLRDYLNAQKKKTKKNVSPIIKNEKPKKEAKTKADKIIKSTINKNQTNIKPILAAGATTTAATTAGTTTLAKNVNQKKKVTNQNKDKKVTKKKTQSLVVPGVAKSTKTARQRRTEQLAKLAFRSANLMKEGPGRERAMERARKIAFRDLAGGGTANGKPIPEGSAGAGLRALKAVNPSITRNMGYAKMGGITKRRFGGMAKGGFKMPNKVSKS
jgi:hypothetical protein